ncbi:unnamed protein product [Notodromas monacha]|uniref:Receptor L-domain domain-containing protein n=1 Tax=Notodromas monacha TaxID=399045 RepID=A0A7R9BJP3_9CRUS|nr:unnamed protein product [Notodromas monacha]CAG0915351.1 unnamed protein product [Notodromas monacha]
MSVGSNREHHYQNLRDRYTNCTFVDGNLEITWLNDENMDLSFLENIREVTGYVLISHVNVRNVILPRLQIIRGRTLFKLPVHGEFALAVTLSKMDTLQMPALRVPKPSVRFRQLIRQHGLVRTCAPSFLPDASCCLFSEGHNEAICRFPNPRVFGWVGDNQGYCCPRAQFAPYGEFPGKRRLCNRHLEFLVEIDVDCCGKVRNGSRKRFIAHGMTGF